MSAVHLAKWISAVGGAILVAGHLVAQLDASLLAHLDAHFASKADLQRVEEKIDQVLIRVSPAK